MSRIYAFCLKSLRIIAIVVSVVILLTNLYYRVEISYDVGEHASIVCNILHNAGLVLVFAGLLLFCMLLQKQMWRINQNRLFIMLSIGYMLFAAYLILNSTNVIRADASSVFNCALRVKNGDYSMFQPKEYMHTYPHQIGLMLFDLLIVQFSENPSFVFFINALLVLGINFTSWQISKLIWEDTKIHLMVILLSFMFVPQLFFIMFAYGQIPGLLFLLISVYHTIKYVKTYRISNLVLLIVSLSVSVLVRQNYLIGACAIGIYLIMEFLKRRNYHQIVAVVCLVLGLTVSNKMMVSVFENKANTSLDNGCPSVLWVAMGTDIDNRNRSAGWYDASSYNIYMNANADANAAAAQGWIKLGQNVEKALKRPGETLVFFKDKIVSQWCEPLYQSVWSGPMLKGSQETYTSFLQSLYSGESVEDSFETYSKGLSLMIWISYIAFLLSSRKTEGGWEIAALYFIGGFLFHIIWEGKSQYIYPYVFCLIPFASCGLYSMIASGQQKLISVLKPR